MATKQAIENTPKEVIAGPYRYGVSFDEEMAYDYKYLGVCLSASKRLKLDPRQADTELPQTLLHEVLHALGLAYEIPDWCGHKTDNDGKITDKIDLMASALLTFIRQNPGLIRWLQEQR